VAGVHPDAGAADVIDVIGVTIDREDFAAERKAVLRKGEDTLFRSVRLALGKFGKEGWYDALVRRAETMARAAYRTETGKVSGKALRTEMAQMRKTLTESLDKTTNPKDYPGEKKDQITAIAASISTAAHNAGMLAAGQDEVTGKGLGKTWLSMDDDAVRPAHRDADGQKVPLDEKFHVGGVEMDYPGDMSAPIDLWINCRCVLGLEYMDIEKAVTAGGMENTMSDDVMTDDLPDLGEADKIVPETTTPWYGVLAPEGVLSGDGRKFADNSLRHRDLPLPLAWQKTNEGGHDGSVVVGRIDEVWRKDGQMRGRGMFLSTPEADEAVGLLAEGGIRGVSVDADDGTMQMELKDGTPLEEAMDALQPETDDDPGEGIDLEDIVTVFTDARICGATLCPIPAFQEAFVALGEMPDDFGPDEGETIAASLVEFRSISEKPWDGSASRFDNDQWCQSTIISLESGCTSKSEHKLPILEPDGSLSRAGVHAAAGRIGQTDAPPAALAKAKAALRTAYRELGEDPPDSLKAEAETETFDRGPGWGTAPEATRRIHDYWTKPTKEGYSKIRWGVPGDFNRCRTHLSKYVKPDFLSQTCAQWHHDALGIWPGRPTTLEPIVADGAVHILDFDTPTCDGPPASWFTDPHLVELTPLSITSDGHVFGHLAGWQTCHIGQPGCVVAPPSSTDYAYFRTGIVQCADGSEVAVGCITMDTGHAGRRMSAQPTISHYDNTGTVVADIACGEDEFGIWFSGAVRPGVPDEKVRALRAAGKVSGDWRDIGGSLELVAALAVNVGGFPIPRTSLAVAEGRQISLVAAGVVDRPDTVSGADITEIVKAAVEEYETGRERRKAMAELRREAMTRRLDTAGRR
jgi:hypothetical protein